MLSSKLTRERLHLHNRWMVDTEEFEDAGGGTTVAVSEWLMVWMLTVLSPHLKSNKEEKGEVLSCVVGVFCGGKWINVISSADTHCPGLRLKKHAKGKQEGGLVCSFRLHKDAGVLQTRFHETVIFTAVKRQLTKWNSWENVVFKTSFADINYKVAFI